MILADLVQLLYRVPGAVPIFLRREQEKLGGVLRLLARFHRRMRIADTRVIVVVGSLGKTTTRRALHAALACPERGFSYSNYGSSLAANLLRVRPRDRHAVIEAGISAPGYMAGYARMLQPDIVVVTSIKSDHYRSFPTLDDTRNEKAKIVSALVTSGIAILNGDDPRVRWMATQTRAQVLTFGTNDDNDIQATNLKNSPAGLSFDVRMRNGHYPVRTRLFGEHMVYPCLAALTVAEVEGIPMDGVLRRLAGLEAADSRMTLVHLPNAITILDDSFKNSIDTIYSAFDAFVRLPARRRIVVMGPAEDPPGRQGDINREIGRRVAFADLVICVGGRAMSGVRSGAVAAGMDRSAIRLMDHAYAPVASLLMAELRPGDAVLVKGQSTQRLRRIVLRLLGRPAACTVRYCVVKVPSCDACPLLNAAPDLFRNRFIARSVRELSEGMVG